MHNDKISRSVSVFGSVFLAIGLLAVSQPAQAGFQWVAPGAAEQPAPPTRAPLNLDAFPPAQIIEGKPAPLPPVSARTQDGPMSLPAVTPKEDVVRGFADNIPLSVALRQVLPQDVGFSVAQDVSLGTLVSWKGGAPWREVMKRMLSPVGLTIKEQDHLVQVVRATGVQFTGSADDASPASSLSVSTGGSSVDISVGSSAQKESVNLPPASASSRGIPDRNAPGGVAPGYLAPPTSLISSSSAPATKPEVSPLPVSMHSPYVMSNTVDAWTANKGDTLQKVLETWARRANVELSWQAEFDFPMQASASFTGSFEVAVRSLLMGFQDAQPQPVGYLYNNQAAGQTVLVVQARGNNYNE